MADELIDQLTPSGSFTGKVIFKSEAHKKGLWHASVQIWIYTPKGEILIQKRAIDKDTYPNLWDISVAGHLSAGDNPISAAIREIDEEIGLRISAKALQLFKVIKNNKKPNEYILDNEFNHIFICSSPIILKNLKLQKEEVAEVKLMQLNNFESQLKNNYTSFVPHGMEYYDLIIKSIKEALN